MDVADRFILGRVRDRGSARSPRPELPEPEQLCGPKSPNVARLGLSEEQLTLNGGVAIPDSAQVYVGIDVSAKQLDVAIRPTGQTRQYTNDPEGVASIMDQIVPLEPCGVVLEATGGFEMLLAGELELAGLPVSLVNPRQVRSFARATGRLAKTDAIDAQVLAQFAEAVKPPVRPLPDADTLRFGVNALSGEGGPPSAPPYTWLPSSLPDTTK